MKEYDVIIAGGGVAGVFSAYRISQQKNIKACLIEFGRPPGKRRKQLEGWLGCFPTSNTRLYMDDINTIELIVGSKSATKASQNVLNVLSQYGDIKPTKNKKPNDSVKTRISNLGYDINYLTYAQWKPENVHALSKDIADKIEARGNIDFEFDNEIKSIRKIPSGKFILETENGTFSSKKLILSVGRSGWRFAKTILNNFGIIENDDFAKFGFMAEVPVSGNKDWNNCHCSLLKENITIGPISWGGTVIPEDHVDLVISSWRSNEDRWASEKAAFSVRITQKFNKAGSFQTERLGKLAFVLSDNRVGKIKVSEYINGHHDLALVPEYNWLKGCMSEINNIFPNFLNKGYINVPDISLVVPKIKIKKNLSTELVEGLYLAGETAGIQGLISACLSGYIAGDSACK